MDICIFFVQLVFYVHQRGAGHVGQALQVLTEVFQMEVGWISCETSDRRQMMETERVRTLRGLNAPMDDTRWRKRGAGREESGGGGGSAGRLEQVEKTAGENV